jgi:glycosyltransferase involved in cell wall biosynthesis
MRLGIVYHMPFWQAADGSLWELEGSFARYVDSLAPYFAEISLCVPVQAPQTGGTRVQATNVRLTALPGAESPKGFYPRLPFLGPRIVRWVSSIDLLHCRVPTPAAFTAFLAARVFRRPVFLLVVGDLRALLSTVPYRGLKRTAWNVYTNLEEWTLDLMVRRALTFANGAALARKHDRPESRAVETRTTTIREQDIGSRRDTCGGEIVRLLTVSRIEPRKGLGCLPKAVARLRASGRNVDLDIVGPVVGRPGQAERTRIVDEAERAGVAGHVRLRGAIPLQDLLPLYCEYDLFVLPTLPGEGVPRVLLEAMAAGLPVIATRVAGIPSLIAHERNGLLIDESSDEAVAGAAERLMADATLRQRLIREGYVTARATTVDVQAASMMHVVTSWLDAAPGHRVAAAS